MLDFGRKPFIIAEMSGNHNQSLERALKIVDASNNVKEQTSVSAEELQSHWKKLQAEYKKTVKHNRNLRLNELPLESSSVEDSPEYSE